MVSKKHPFWLALIFTIAVFLIGISLGFFLEGTRTDSIEISVLDSEINLMDEQLRNRVIGTFDLNCSVAIESTFSFADDVYFDAKTLENYVSASNFENSLGTLHKRYDLLRTILWAESVELRNKCGADFHTLVYLYEFDSEDLDLVATQRVFSKVLEELKAEHGSDILLIPIAGNLDLESVNLLTDKYEITDFPAIIVDEGVIIRDIPELTGIEEVVFGSNE